MQNFTLGDSALYPDIFVRYIIQQNSQFQEWSCGLQGNQKTPKQYRLLLLSSGAPDLKLALHC